MELELAKGGSCPHPILSMSLISFGKVQERAKCICYKKTLPMGIWEALRSLMRASQSLVKIHSENNIGVQSGLLFLKDQDSDDKLFGGKKSSSFRGWNSW